MGYPNFEKPTYFSCANNLFKCSKVRYVVYTNNVLPIDHLKQAIWEWFGGSPILRHTYILYAKKCRVDTWAGDLGPGMASLYGSVEQPLSIMLPSRPLYISPPGGCLQGPFFGQCKSFGTITVLLIISHYNFIMVKTSSYPCFLTDDWCLLANHYEPPFAKLYTYSGSSLLFSMVLH